MHLKLNLEHSEVCNELNNDLDENSQWIIVCIYICVCFTSVYCVCAYPHRSVYSM